MDRGIGRNDALTGILQCRKTKGPGCANNAPGHFFGQTPGTINLRGESMREDMFKVIVERPRLGWRSAPRARNRLAGENDLPATIGLKRHVAITRIRSRWLNENLNPLKRYLGRQIGRRWDDVYSEISATLAPGHTVKAHVRQHIDDFVARRVTIGRDGQLMNASLRGLGLQRAPWHQAYYVDPEDGILKDSEILWTRLKLDPRSWRKREAKQDPNVRVLGPMRELRCLEGIWYEIRFEQMHWQTNALTFDVLQRTLVPSCTRHAVAKRQLPRGELRFFGLSNIHYD